MSFSFFKNKKVLVTGHTGFKGAWLSIWLEMLGAKVAGIALDPLHADGIFQASRIGGKIRDYRADIRNLPEVKKIFAAEQPEIVFHLAAQPLVLESYRNPVETFETNVQGTVHILEAIRQTPSVKAAVMVTTDKCYENQEWPHGYRESDPLGGHDPYSASKGAAELAIASYRRSFFSRKDDPAVASARAGNVIGGGDWADSRLVPDIIRAVLSGETLEIRSPEAVRPWQHVLEPLGGYLLLAMQLLGEPGSFSEAWNFGPLPENVVPVKELVTTFHHHLKSGNWLDVSNGEQAHEAGLLMLDINKAIHRLGWQPILNFQETIALTTDWYANAGRESALNFSQNQIKKYLELWKSRSGKLPAFLKSSSRLTSMSVDFS